MSTLRLDWPQFQGGEPAAVESLTPGLTAEQARLAYGIGGRIAALVAPPARGLSETVPVAPYSADPHEADGIIDKPEILAQNAFALEKLRAHGADRVVTVGGCCSVSAAPFAHLAAVHGDDLAIIWLDSHPDTNLPGGINHGFNTMVVSHLIGRGDADILGQLPATVAPERIALAGTHAWDDQDPENIERWGLTRIAPSAREEFVAAVVAWVRSTGCSKVALHFDLDVVASGQVAFGMAHEPHGIALETAVAVIGAVDEAFDLVGLTVAEFVSREAAVLRSVLGGLPLLNDH